VSAASWLCASAAVLWTLHPLWGAPLQADDIVEVLLVNRFEEGVLPNALASVEHNLRTSSTHFTPLGDLLQGLLKGAMLATTSPVLTASVIHHGFIAAVALTMLALCAHLLGALLSLTGGVRISASRLAVPLALGFAVSVQVTAPWSIFDPLVAHPVFGALPPVFGVAFLLVSVRALAAEPGSGRGTLVLGALIAVAHTVLYEVSAVFFAVLVVVALVGRSRFHDVRRRLAWLILPAMVTLAVGRQIVATRPTTGYPGTIATVDLSLLPTWVVAVQTSVPGSTWGLASVRGVDLAATGPYALLGAALLGAALLGWAVLLRRGGTSGAEHAAWTARGSATAVVPVLALIVLAPAPYVISDSWGAAVRVLGTTYMHSFLAMWCWAMLFAVLAAHVTVRISGRRQVVAGLVAVLAVTAWTATQLSINRQLGTELQANPFRGLDIAEVLADPNPEPEPERCASLATLWQDVPSGGWYEILNREHTERHGEPYCSE
jgi:hypothetical protein